jgi:hypothetical protein
MALRKFYASLTGLLFAFAMLAGCASTNVTQQTPMTARGLARPNQIWVYDFVATSSAMPTDSSLAGRVGAPSTPPTPEEIETGRKYGAMIARDLVKDIQAMGMPAIEAGPGSSPQVGDCVIRGYIVSTEGSGAVYSPERGDRVKHHAGRPRNTGGRPLLLSLLPFGVRLLAKQCPNGRDWNSHSPLADAKCWQLTLAHKGIDGDRGAIEHFCYTRNFEGQRFGFKRLFQCGGHLHLSKAYSNKLDSQG